jgi:hypothetical protein
MYRPYRNGTTEVIQKLTIHVPPVGYVYGYLTGKLEKRPIYKRSEDKNEQYWEIPPRPARLKQRLQEEIRKRGDNDNSSYVDPELKEFRDLEWDRRMNGMWLYINGEPTYITGGHYFYMAHWSIDVGPPKYRSTDRTWFLFWQYCCEDPFCWGLVEVTIRRQGKSYRATCVAYELTSRTFSRISGMQSKTDKDAERLFRKHLILPFKKLLPFFIPTIDMEKGTSPKEILRFYKTAKKGVNTSIYDQYESSIKELEAEIDYRSSSELAYDGDKMLVYICDEAGKSKHANVYTRHSVIKPCLTDNENIIGKAVYTTTVEDIGDSDKYEEGNFKALWDESNVDERGSNNETTSGLYQYFLSGILGLMYDKFGNPREKENLERLLQARDQLKNRPLALNKLIRKYPFTIEEAFYTAGEEAIYDVVAINKQLAAIEAIPEEDLYLRGDLEWKNDIRYGTVVFKERVKGKFLFNKKYDIVEECKRKNVQQYIGNTYKPLFTKERIIGVDSYDHKNVADGGAKSKGAAYLYFKLNPSDPLSETFVCEYVNRPPDPEILYEDIILLSWVSGAEILAENNKPGFLNYAENNKFGKFVVNYGGGNTPGVAASNKSHAVLASTTETYLKDNLPKVVFKKLLRCWSVFNLVKTTKFDEGMASGWTLVGAAKIRGEKMSQVDDEDNEGLIDITELEGIL